MFVRLLLYGLKEFPDFSWMFFKGTSYNLTSVPNPAVSERHNGQGWCTFDIMTNDATTESCVSFKIGHDLFAANVSCIHDILEVGTIAPTPQGPVFMKGVMNLRGEALPVVDSRVMFGLPTTTVTDNTSILVMNLATGKKRLRVGVMVDAVSEVVQVDTDEIMPLPSTETRYPLDFVRGTVKSGNAFIYLLDVVNAFATEALLTFQTAA